MKSSLPLADFSETDEALKSNESFEEDELDSLKSVKLSRKVTTGLSELNFKFNLVTFKKVSLV